MIVDRILKIINLKGISKHKFYIATALSNGFLDKVKDIGSSKIEKILSTYPDINPEWLLTGKGEMLRSEGKLMPFLSKGKSIPLVDVEAIGGFGNSIFRIQEQDIMDEYVVPDFESMKPDFMIRVKGSSMNPKYNSGDVVACKIIKESNFIQWNKTHVIATKEQGILIKRIDISDRENHVKCISDNENYRPFDVPKDEIIGIALVIGVIRLE